MTRTLRRNLVAVLALLTVMLGILLLDIGIAPEHVYPGRTAVFPWLELLIVAGVGLLGAGLAARTELVAVLPPPGAPGLLVRAGAYGLGLGVLLALLDAWLRIGDINVGLPLAPLFYLWGAISQELLTHFGPVALAVGIASFFRQSNRAQRAVFWVVAVAMSALAAVGMIGAFQNPDVPLDPQLPIAPMVIGGAVFVIEVALFAMLARAGLFAALAMRLGFYAIWHIAWPALAY